MIRVIAFLKLTKLHYPPLQRAHHRPRLPRPYRETDAEAEVEEGRPGQVLPPQHPPTTQEHSPPQEPAAQAALRTAPGTNCIETGPPGKLILCKRKGHREVLFS